MLGGAGVGVGRRLSTPLLHPPRPAACSQGSPAPLGRAAARARPRARALDSPRRSQRRQDKRQETGGGGGRGLKAAQPAAVFMTPFFHISPPVPPASASPNWHPACWTSLDPRTSMKQRMVNPSSVRLSETDGRVVAARTATVHASSSPPLPQLTRQGWHSIKPRGWTCCTWGCRRSQGCGFCVRACVRACAPRMGPHRTGTPARRMRGVQESSTQSTCLSLLYQPPWDPGDPGARRPRAGFLSPPTPYPPNPRARTACASEESFEERKDHSLITPSIYRPPNSPLRPPPPPLSPPPPLTPSPANTSPRPSIRPTSRTKTASGAPAALASAARVSAGRPGAHSSSPDQSLAAPAARARAQAAARALSPASARTRAAPAASPARRHAVYVPAADRPPVARSMPACRRRRRAPSPAAAAQCGDPALANRSAARS